MENRFVKINKAKTNPVQNYDSNRTIKDVNCLSVSKTFTLQRITNN